MSDVLIVFYSRTGKTRLVAHKLAALLDADVEELHDRKNRAGAINWLRAGFDATLRRITELESLPDGRPYKVVLLGMPVWSFQMPPAMRAYVEQTDLAGKTVCAFCTLDGSGAQSTFQGLNDLLPQRLADALCCKKPREGDPELDRVLAEWAEKIRGLAKA